jgi:nicotinamidase-related amidase
LPIGREAVDLKGGSRLDAMNELPLPDFYAPERVGEVWRVSYEERARDARLWAPEQGIRPATEDSVRVCVLAVDVQNTFCIPGFELFVGGRSGTGAVDDNRRLCEFVYRNLGLITQVVPSLDTHRAMQIFHAVWLVDADGNHPEPYTLASAEDVQSGRWRVNPGVCKSLGLDRDDAERQLVHYTRALDEGGKYELTIWPYHALLGGIGHALVSAVEEAFFFHGMARDTQPSFQQKGEETLTEHYSILGPEVTVGPDGEALGRRNQELIQVLLGYDAVIVAGQAKSHCVAWTIDDLLQGDSETQRLAERVYLLEDCTSPVVVPGVVDYTDQADAAFERFVAAGMHVVRSTDPLAEWPGLGQQTASLAEPTS